MNKGFLFSMYKTDGTVTYRYHDNKWLPSGHSILTLNNNVRCKNLKVITEEEVFLEMI